MRGSALFASPFDFVASAWAPKPKHRFDGFWLMAEEVGLGCPLAQFQRLGGVSGLHRDQTESVRGDGMRRNNR